MFNFLDHFLQAVRILNSQKSIDKRFEVPWYYVFDLRDSYSHRKLHRSIIDNEDVRRIVKGYYILFEFVSSSSNRKRIAAMSSMIPGIMVSAVSRVV